MRLLPMAGLVLASASMAQPPVFSFGVVTDIQYADQAAAGKRDYRASTAKLADCAAALAREHTAFVVQLGDLVDGGAASLDRILPVWERVRGPRYHVLGNHDFVLPRAALLERLGLQSPYYEFSVRDWRFVVLDGMHVSASRGGAALLEELRRAGAPNAQEWNGAVGPEQRRWLEGVLADAARRRQRAVVFCHFPVLAAACRPEHLLWDHDQVLSILETQPAVAAWMNGHDHRGGYAARQGIHHVTFPGLVEIDAASACRVVDVYTNRLVVRIAGKNGLASGLPALILRD